MLHWNNRICFLSQLLLNLYSDRKLERELLESQYINAHNIGVLQVASKKNMNVHMLRIILSFFIYIGYVDSCRLKFSTYVVISHHMSKIRLSLNFKWEWF